jgi:hypothetical protein
MMPRLVLLVCVFCGVLGAQGGEPPAPKTDAAPRSGDADAPLFRWRVGASLGAGYSALLVKPEHDRSMPNAGMQGEFALWGRVTHRDSGVSANLRVCWGCHGLELEEAALAWRPLPVFSVRAGRLNVHAGSFNARHDFNTRATLTKPLTRMMGGMVRQTEFNQGVLPAPYVDNGVNAALELDFGAAAMRLDGYVLAGLKGVGNDIAFDRSRNFPDNNGEPSFGATFGLETPLLSLHLAYLWGNYDADARRSYQIASADFGARLGPVTLEGEIAWRQTQFTRAGSPGGEDQFWKWGWWLQADWNIVDTLRLTLAADSLNVKGIYLASFGPTPNAALAVTDDNNRVIRGTLGLSYTTVGGVLLRLSGEYWEFSDFNDAWVVQAGIGWAF